jgi:DNA sulfur modification protein DndD
MKLISIELYNYRPFYGQTPEIIFASKEGKNTTVIHGNNGAGKTAILNAFTWVLYERFTPGFARSEQIVNQRAIAEAAISKWVECWVKIIFEHNGKKYLAKRVRRAIKDNTLKITEEKSNLTLSYAEHDGRWVRPSQPSEDIINQVLPEKLRKYFFFDGERIEEIVQDDKKAEMSDTTKILLGVKAIDRAIQHLGDAERELEQEYKKIASVEDANLIQTKQDLEDELQSLKERQDEIAKELDNYRELENQVDEQLRSSENVRELQTKRDEIDRDIDSIKEQVNNSKRKIKELISRNSYKVFLSEATIDFCHISGELRKRGELPSGIKQQFVKDLLQQQTCICGTKLVEGSPSYSSVEKWLDKAGIEDIEETVIRMCAEVNLIDKEIPILWENIDVEKINQGQLIRKQSDLENQIEDIHDRLKNSPLEDIRQLENRREQIKKSIERLFVEKGENKAKIEAIACEIGIKIQFLTSQKANEVKQKLALQRIKVTQETIKLLSKRREIKNKRFSVELEQAIQDIFGEISFKPYIPKLSNNYELTLVETTSGQPKSVAASSGENVILSLSFISSIISKVREWSQQQNSINLGNSTFPVVMDNPFSKLDTPYDKLVAKLIPRLADQLILITNKVQWRNEVEQEMNEYIGKHYVLTYFSPKPDYKEDSNISLYDRSYPLVKRSPNDWEYTEILEINRYN